MKCRNVWGIATVLVLVVLATQTPGFAGISAVNDEKGNYTGSRTTATRTAVEPLVWTEAGRRVGDHAVLNPGGDGNGDLLPVLTESNKVPHYPWVVWSRFSGTDYDLAWSRWVGQSWSTIKWVEKGGSVHDDLDPDLEFDVRGRPFITWWRDIKGDGHVFVSVNLNGKWLTPSQVSMSKIDSRFPTIHIRDNGKIHVEFMTPRGLMRQTLIFWQPTSITDDITPHFELKGEAVIIGQPFAGMD